MVDFQTNLPWEFALSSAIKKFALLIDSISFFSDSLNYSLQYADKPTN